MEIAFRINKAGAMGSIAWLTQNPSQENPWWLTSPLQGSQGAFPMSGADIVVCIPMTMEFASAAATTDGAAKAARKIKQNT